MYVVSNDYVNEAFIAHNLKCAICNESFIDPVTISCHHSFCYQCLEKWLKDYKLTCPTCRQTVSINSSTRITLINFLAMLDQVFVKCKLCVQFNIQRGDYEDHINKICSKAIVSCPASCPWMGLRGELQAHLTT